MDNQDDAKLLYFSTFNNLPDFLPMMATYEDDIFQNLMKKAVLRGKPLTDEEISKAYANKVDLIRFEEEPVDMKKLFNL